MKFKTCYQFAHECKSRPSWNVPEDDPTNCVIVERTGYIPLAVRLKQFTIAGLQMSIQRKQFDFDDYKDLYHDFEVISPNDDIEEAQSKLDEFYLKQNEIYLKQFENLKQGSITSERELGASDKVNVSSEDLKD